MPASSDGDIGRTPESALPSVAPIKNSGVTSPPLNPAPSVITVNTNFAAHWYAGCRDPNEATIVGIPRPIYRVVPLRNTPACHYHPAGKRPQRRPRNVPPEQTADRVRRPRKRPRHQPEHHPRNRRAQQPPRVHRRRPAHPVNRVLHAPRVRRQVPRKGCQKARRDRLVAHRPDRQHLDPKHRARKWRPEHRGKTRAHACHQQHPPPGPVQPKRPRQLVGQRGAGLDRRPFPTRRPPKQVRQKRTQQDQRCHAKRYRPPRIMDLVKDQVVPGLDRRPQVPVQTPHQQPGNRQQRNQPAMAFPRFRRPVQRHQQHR